MKWDFVPGVDDVVRAIAVIGEVGCDRACGVASGGDSGEGDAVVVAIGEGTAEAIAIKDCLIDVGCVVDKEADWENIAVADDFRRDGKTGVCHGKIVARVGVA